MIIGHLPAGYIASTLLFPRFEVPGLARKAFLAAGMLGAVAPDLDMFYFHLIDHRAHSHHSYVSHFPVVWLTLLSLSSLWHRQATNPARPALAVIFTLNGFIHMFLDYIAGNIHWLAPFVNEPFSLFEVAATHQPWWLNFILHRTFGLEIAIVLWAAWLWRRERPGYREPGRALWLPGLEVQMDAWESRVKGLLRRGW
ncbi:MAG TPA: metal-dependent hydrolase [Methylococcaceae bacterium]|nr:metal-dependent hydrolase [Methylococcaceae bacterium]